MLGLTVARLFLSSNASYRKWRPLLREIVTITFVVFPFFCFNHLNLFSAEYKFSLKNIPFANPPPIRPCYGTCSQVGTVSGLQNGQHVYSNGMTSQLRSWPSWYLRTWRPHVSFSHLWSPPTNNSDYCKPDSKIADIIKWRSKHQSSVVHLSPRMTSLDPRRIHMGFVVSETIPAPFPRITSVSPCQYHSTNAPCSITHPSPTVHYLSTRRPSIKHSLKKTDQQNIGHSWSQSAVTPTIRHPSSPPFYHYC